LALLRRILVNNDIDIPHRLHASAYKILGKKKALGEFQQMAYNLQRRLAAATALLQSTA